MVRQANCTQPKNTVHHCAFEWEYPSCHRARRRYSRNTAKVLRGGEDKAATFTSQVRSGHEGATSGTYPLRSVVSSWYSGVVYTERTRVFDL